MSMAASVGGLAFAQDRKEVFGDWSLERLPTSISLAYRASVPQGDAIKTAELDFVCGNAGKIGATIIPFDGTYDNQQDEVFVLVERYSRHSGSHLRQQWSNGYKYLFLSQQGRVDDLVRFLKVAQGDGEASVEILFAGDFDGKGDILRIEVGLSDFSKGFSQLEAACANKSQ
jgi:hypothetical protein